MPSAVTDMLKRSNSDLYQCVRFLRSGGARLFSLSTIGIAVIVVFMASSERDTLSLQSKLRSVDGNVQGMESSHDRNCLTDHGDRNERKLNLSLSMMPKCARDNGRASAFLIVFMGHSGSTALITALEQHSQVHVQSLEPLDHKEMQFDTNRSLLYADQFFTTARRLNKTGGFKVRPRHLINAPDRWVALMRKHGVRIIWNYRKNLLKQAIGHYPIVFMKSRDAYEGLVVQQGENAENQSGNAATPRSISRLRIENMEGLSRILKDRIAGEATVEHALRRLGIAGRRTEECTLPISYESILVDPKMSVARAQMFLGLDMNEIHSPLRAKATEDNLCELVENHSQLCNAFYGCTHLRWMLDDMQNNCMCDKLVTAEAFISRKYCPAGTH